MAAKNKRSNLREVIASAEGRIKTAREVSITEVAALTARLSEVEEQAQDIKDGITAVSEVQARWRRGEAIEPTAYAAAVGEDARVSDLSVFLPRRIEAATRNLPSTGTLIADYIAPAFGPLLPGVEVIATNAPYREWSKDVPADALALVIVEPLARAIEVNPTTGEHSGRVEVYYFRPGLYRPIEVSSLEDTARSLGIAVTVSRNQVADVSRRDTADVADENVVSDPSSSVVDTLTVQVFGALDGLPVIRHAYASSPVKTWCINIFSGASQTEGYSTNHVNIQNPDQGWRVAYGASVARGVDPKISEVVSDDGERTLTMKAVVNVSGVNVNDFVGALNECAQKSVGGVDGNGLLSEVNVSLRESGRLSGTHAVDVALTYRSQVPSGEWIQQRTDEMRERDAVASQREMRKAEAEDRREASRRKLHPGEQAAIA